MASIPLIEAVEIAKSYRLDSVETQVLKGINLSIEDRGLLSIAGASGAGKSTLLHILSSLDPPTSGRVLFEGKDLYREKEEALSEIRNRSIGFVFQFHHLMPEFSALENVMMPLLVRGDRRAAAKKKALDLVEQLGLQGRKDHLPGELSGGEQQRIAVARALVTSPRILFADEPTGNLDHENGDRLIDLFFQLHKSRKMTLVLVTHNRDIAARFPRRIFMEDGTISKVEGKGEAA